MFSYFLIPTADPSAGATAGSGGGVGIVPLRVFSMVVVGSPSEQVSILWSGEESMMFMVIIGIIILNVFIMCCTISSKLTGRQSMLLVVQHSAMV
jgi:hypothetical protein